MINQFKTALLLTILSALVLGMGHLLGGQTGLYAAIIVALIINGIAYFFSDRLVLHLYRAHPLNPHQFRDIYTMVGELAHSMHLPMPRLWLIDTPMANAFATGRNPHNASVAVTTGILRLLDRRELRGVLAHELSHIKNRDILISTIAATLATIIGYVADMLRWRNHKNRRSNALALFIASLIIPIAATLLQLALSRSREFLADETGATACHDPLALAGALEKLHSHIPHAPLDDADTVHASTASLFIVNPFTKNGFIALFSTHPPLVERIARLKKLYQTMHRS